MIGAGATCPDSRAPRSRSPRTRVRLLHTLPFVPTAPWGKGMVTLVRVAVLFALLSALNGGESTAATPKEIETAKKRGVDFLRGKYAKEIPQGEESIGAACMAGLAMLEYGVPGADPAIKTITAAVREAAYKQNRTYGISLCLMYLDRYGEPSDLPLIQFLAVRLLAGQTVNKGWSYECVPAIPQADEQRLRAIKPGVPAKFHPEVARYAESLRGTGGGVADDNSNTQFAVIAVWMSRKHGVPVDAALQRIRERFITNQNPKHFGWAYIGGVESINDPGSPAMYCAGLIGLSTGIALDLEQRAKNEPKADPKLDPKKQPARPMTLVEQRAAFAFKGLGNHLAEAAKNGKNGGLVLKDAEHGHYDLYFLWSVERVGVIYGYDKIGGIDWYDAGAESLVRAQAGDGSWPGSYGPEVNTSFAVLFLCRSNLARDLSGKVQKETSTEMRAGAGPSGPKDPTTPGTKIDPFASPELPLPAPAGSEVATLAAELLRAGDNDWAKTLAKLQTSKGSINTQALVTAVGRLEGDKRKEARAALAERLTRMNAETLRAMAKSEEPELRRGAVLAMAMKDDKGHVPDIVAAMSDEEDMVVRAARAGLLSLTGEDFGPRPNATAGEKALTAKDWQEWLAKQKKK